jgi:hypothetical protein
MWQPPTLPQGVTVEDMPGKPNPDKDERVKIPLDPETALRALLAVDPDDEPADDDRDDDGKQERG